MGISFRYFLFEGDGPIRRLPHRVSTALALGRDALPFYADSRQRIVEVVVENEGGKPVRILDAIGTYWDFDEEGKIDHALRRRAGDWLEAAFASETKPGAAVVDLVPEIKKKALHDRDRWTVTKEDLDRIAADLWPGINGRPHDLTPVRGAMPKKPALTFSAKNALYEIASDITPILLRIARLTEHDLKGLAFEARRTSTFGDKALWEGIANEADRLCAIRAVHRTGRGEWYAVIEAYRTIKGDIVEDLIVAHEKCASRNAAVEAGKRLMTEKADWLSAEVRVEVCIWSALEWLPEE